MTTVTLTFSAGGNRWHLRRLCGEPLAIGGGESRAVTGLLFESDSDASRFLPLSEEVLPTNEEFSRSSAEDLSRYLGWATILPDGA